MKSVRIDQSHEVMAKLATNVDWTKVDGSALQQAVKDPVALGIEFARFLNNAGRVIVQMPGTLAFVGDFDPVAFLGKGWSVVAEDCDFRENGLESLDLSKVRFETCLKEDEISTNGEERINRLKGYSNRICLGGRSFRTCWVNRNSLPESWKKDDKGSTRYIFFDGLVLLSPSGDRFSLYLYHRGGQWARDHRYLNFDRDARLLSAVLE